MKVLLCTTAALALALGAVPAGADDVAPQATDVCGDGGTALTHGDERVEAESAGEGLDLRSAGVRVVRPVDGPAVLLGVLGTCGPASEAVDHHLSWRYADGCVLQLRRSRTLVGEQPATVLEEHCDEDGAVRSSRAWVALADDAFSVVGDTVLFRVPLEQVPGSVLPRLAPGASWTSTRASVTAPPVPFPGYGVGLHVGGRDASTRAALRADELAGAGGAVEQPQA